MKNMVLLVVFVVVACGDSTSPERPDLSGNWQFSGVFSNAQLSASCTGSGTATLVHSGNSLSGTVVQQGSCNSPSGVVDNSGTFQMTGGQVSGSNVSFQLGSCSYTGTYSGNPPNRITGATTCILALLGQNYQFTGTWQAGR